MKTYSQAPDASSCIDKILAAHHEDLEGVSVTALFVFDTETSLPVLTHQGYAAGAVVRITPVKDRAMGMADATIVIDRAGWLALSQRQRDALIDHELTHLTRKLDKDSGDPLTDVLDRPKLVMRKHDHQFGWFDEVAQRHGQASPEVCQARRLMESSGQLYFDFEPTAQPPADDGDMSTTGRRIQATAAKAARKAKRDSAKQAPLN
jgi:hypothetical protein